LFSSRDPEVIRERLGAEVYQRVQRTRELLRSPQPLTEADAAVLRAAAAPLLRDLAATRMPVPDIRSEAHEDRPWAVCGWIAGRGATGQGVWVMRDGSSAGQVRELAEQFQSWASDVLAGAGQSPEWPLCPEHDRGHGLMADVRDGAAVWVCLHPDHVIAPIGALMG
jgi:aminoglycoside phosphotransferase (APT) family kinase protein